MIFAVSGLGNIIPLDLTAEMAQLGMGIGPLLPHGAVLRGGSGLSMTGATAQLQNRCSVEEL
jgi:hypothetical protein